MKIIATKDLIGKFFFIRVFTVLVDNQIFELDYDIAHLRYFEGLRTRKQINERIKELMEKDINIKMQESFDELLESF